MAIWTNLGISGATAAVGAGVVSVITLVLGLFFFVPQSEDSSITQDDAQIAVPQAETVVITGAEVTDDQDAATPAQTSPDYPIFDVVRIEPDGSAVIAGSAPAGSIVEIVIDSVPITQVTADANGKFVALFDLPGSDVPRAMRAQTILPDGSRAASVGELLLAPTTPVQTAEVQADETAPPVVLADEGEIKVIQPAAQPAAPTETAEANIVIDTITYDSEGEVVLSGRGDAEGHARVYLDDKSVETTAIEKDGSWSLPLNDVDAGIYTLRVDEVTADGSVSSRVETLFKREEVDLAIKGATAITVQPGYTLWAIAQGQYDDGFQYVRIYDANRDLIRNPHMIYPGQVFAIPQN